ncbi:hypothetical protein Syun_017230 [Stephania yunnanensis]|uniref:Uncharacterized protein n=1 Tax=Stephania yunnanensis TaxID=152371 RepID=A0AAP0J8T3_9MAGN
MMALNHFVSSSSSGALLHPLPAISRSLSSSSAAMDTLIAVKTSVPFVGHNCDPLLQSHHDPNRAPLLFLILRHGPSAPSGDWINNGESRCTKR